jgi:D-hydroxyproline dehydrogenase subunit alpha
MPGHRKWRKTNTHLPHRVRTDDGDPNTVTSPRELVCDVAVIGAGPAGLGAAFRAARLGKQVLLIEEAPTIGGQVWRAKSPLWMQRLARLKVQVLLSTTIVSCTSSTRLIAETRDGALVIKTKSVVVATGARELFVPFPGWTLPNVFGAGAIQSFVEQRLPIAGKRVLVVGTGPLLLPVAAFLKHHGAKVLAVCEQARAPKIGRFLWHSLRRPGVLVQAARYRSRALGIPFRYGWWPKAAHGIDALERVVLTNGKKTVEYECDYLACGFHLVPNIELPALLGCRAQGGSVVVDDLQRTTVPDVFSAGEAAGVAGQNVAFLEGQIAGLASAGALSRAQRLGRKRDRLRKWAALMNDTFALRPEITAINGNPIVCRCENVRWQEVNRHANWKEAKLYSRVGMGPCQGRICGAALGAILGWTAESVRSPVLPARLSSLVETIDMQSKEDT